MKEIPKRLIFETKMMWMFPFGVSVALSSFQNWINGSGVIVLNSSSLPFGIYTLNIMTNQLYQGVFTI